MNDQTILFETSLAFGGNRILFKVQILSHDRFPCPRGSLKIKPFPGIQRHKYQRQYRVVGEVALGKFGLRRRFHPCMKVSCTKREGHH